MPLCFVAIVGMVPFWFSSIDSRRAVLFALDQGISTNLIECGSGFWGSCDEEDGDNISDSDVGDSIDVEILLR